MITEIARAKNEAGQDSYLWLHSSGDCILWSSESASHDDDGAHALARWHLTDGQMAELQSVGIVDETA